MVEIAARGGTVIDATFRERRRADGLKAGGFGFSASWGIAHFDGGGDPVLSVFAPLRGTVLRCGSDIAEQLLFS